MSSIDHFVAAIDAAKRRFDQIQQSLLASGHVAEELQAQFEALGAADKASALGGLRTDLAEHSAKTAVLQQILDQARAQAEALRGSRGTSSPTGTGATLRPEAASVPKPTRSHGAQQKRAGIETGPVRFSVPRKLEGRLTEEHRRQVQEYVDAANQALADGQLSGSGRVRPSRDPKLKNAKEAAAARERARAAAIGEPYGDLVAAHLPDTTWTGTADPPGGWGRHDAAVNASLGSQSDKYPEGYRPAMFELDETWDTVPPESGETTS